MSEDLTRLPTKTYVVLAMLTLREMSGYELKMILEKSLSHFYISPAQSQIYTELRRLESHGLVTMRHVRQDRRPDKRLYCITPQGQEVIQQWFEWSKVESDTYKSPFQFRLFFGHLLSRERQLALVETQRRWLTRSIMILEEREDDLRGRLEGSEPEESLMFPLMVVELKLETFRAELAWTDRAMGRLAQWHKGDEGKRGRDNSAELA